MGKKLINTNSHKSFLEVFNHEKNTQDLIQFDELEQIFCEFQKVGGDQNVILQMIL